MVDAGSVGDDEGRAVIGFGLGHGLEHLRGIGHGDLGDVNVAVGDGHHAEVLLLGALAGGCELRNCCMRGGLGGLSAGVGVHLGIQNQNVDVLALGQHVIQSAVADVIGPAVAAEDPEGLLGQQVLVGNDGLAQLAIAAFDLGDQLLAGLLGDLGVVHAGQPLLSGSLGVGAVGFLDQLADVLRQLGAALVDGQVHAEAELSVVLEQAVRPCGAVAFLVDGVGAGRCGAAIDGGAAGGVGHDHAITEQLGNELDVGSLAAACAGAGELEQGLLELAVLDQLQVQLALELRQRLGELPVGFLILLAGQGLHLQSGLHALLVDRAHADAVAAAGAVQRRNLNAIVVAGEVLADGLLDLKASGNLGALGDQVGTDASVRAHDGAGAAADAGVDVPLGNHDGDAALLVLGGADRDAALGVDHGHGQLVAFLGQDRMHELLEVLGGFDLHRNRAGGGVGPLSGNLDLDQAGDGDVDGVPVLLDDLVALLAVGLLGVGLHVLIRLIVGDDVGQLEEGGLHDGVDAVAHANLTGQLDGVDGVELGFLLGQQLLHGCGQLSLQLLGGPGAVEQEGAALLQRGDHVVHGDVRRVVAGDEVGRVDQIGALDRLVAKAQVGHGDAAGLLGVVGEVCLNILVGVIADDLDGVLVGADGAVRAQTVEHAGHGAGRCSVDGLAQLQRGVGHVVGDAHGEVVLRLVLGQVVVHSLDHGGVELLGAQAVAAADHLDVGAARLKQRGAHVQIQGLAQGAGLLGAVQNGDLLAARRNSAQEVLHGEGTIEVHLDQAQLLALGCQVVDGLFDGVAAGAHADDHALCIGCADVVEGLVVAAGQLANLLHDLGDDVRSGLIELVRSFAALEVDVRVLRGALLMGMIGVQAALAERLDLVPIHQACDLSVVVLGIDCVDLLDLMAGAEAVEEVQERNGGLDCSQMGNQSHVGRFLNGVGGQHCEAGLTAGHDVGVVSEDVQRMIGQRASGNMEDGRHQFAGDLVHVRDHQQQALGCGEGGGHRTGGQGAVHSASRAGLRLHLCNLDLLAKQVGAAMCRPLVSNFRHGGRGGDGVNRCHVAECIGDMADSSIAIASHLDAQVKGPPSVL